MGYRKLLDKAGAKLGNENSEVEKDQRTEVIDFIKVTARALIFETRMHMTIWDYLQNLQEEPRARMIAMRTLEPVPEFVRGVMVRGGMPLDVKLDQKLFQEPQSVFTDQVDLEFLDSLVKKTGLEELRSGLCPLCRWEGKMRILSSTGEIKLVDCVCLSIFRDEEKYRYTHPKGEKHGR